MKTVNIKGKEYVEVNERIKYFRENYSDWALVSELVSDVSGKCIIKALVIDPNGSVKATGYAYEIEGEGYINKTSYIENCETSAWGRALGNFGIGIDAGIASADEVITAISKHETNQAPFGQPDHDDLIKELNTILAKAVSDMIITPDKQSETIANAQKVDDLNGYVNGVKNKLNKIREEIQK